ncbi:MAG TPA: RagB/SusD family nutrient uptake outer membrane protein [Chitinophagaceae bacterium]|nr:RagB/SusD family nutrient uptake outer membrane protein [Chitinophagaceae bacterium]
MYNRGFKIYFLAAALIIVSFTGCKKWLDTEPPLQVDENTVFSNEQGFKEALNGVYLQMGGKSVYGRDMTFGLMSVLGRSYDTDISPAIGNLYFQGARYNFQDPEVKATFKNMWESSYTSIANLNNILDNAESRQNVFSGNNYNTTKGEALGLRAFLHFDLLRMFAPSPAAAGLNIPAIPYVTRISPYAAPVLTTGAIIDSCIADLKTAESLLSQTDMTTSRFTHWAVKGLLARIYLYKGDLSNAQTYALSVINSNKFPLITAVNSDWMFTKEHLFSLYSSFNISLEYYKSVLNTNPPLGFTTQNQTALYVTGGGATSDWRRAFVDPATGTATGNTISPRKCYATSTNNANVLPMIRVTEMYYIAAECATAALDSLRATDLLDSVRVHRNLPKYTLAALNTDSLNIEIRKEYQKEFLSEGQMFYFYKRKNLPFSSLPFTRVPVVADASYVFIRPE